LLQDTLVFRVMVSKLRDAAASYALRDEMLAQVAETPATKVVIDLEEVDFIGSVGFLAFLNTKRQLPDSRIVFCNVSPHILTAFQVCRLVASDATKPGPFEVQSTRDAAVASLAAS
jgi:anti-anti-sigma factor